MVVRFCRHFQRKMKSTAENGRKTGRRSEATADLKAGSNGQSNNSVAEYTSFRFMAKI